MFVITADQHPVTVMPVPVRTTLYEALGGVREGPHLLQACR
jgi:hypothetical protein